VTEEILTLPLRVGWRVARVVLDPVVGIAERILGGTRDDRPERPPERDEPPPVRAREPVTWDEPRPPAPAPTPRTHPESRADELDEPVHVEVEEELVAQVADPGAEDGPGAQLSVDEPWDGYSKMKAADIVDRLAAATPAEVAVVQLYESTHRRRKTVLAAAGHSQRK
jgi:hypothetical protein